MELKVYEEVDLKDYLTDYYHNCWGQAYSMLERMDQIGKLEEFIDNLIPLFYGYEEIDKTHLNDIIAFDDYVSEIYYKLLKE